MKLSANALDPERMYQLLTGVVVPRPIAWVTSLNERGGVNLAPFSCFTFVSSKPPMIGINVGRKAGVLKDTGRNAHAVGELVVHIADESMIPQVHASAVEYPPQVSEVEELGLTTVPSERVRVPRLAIAPIAMECTVHRAIPFGETGSEFLVVEILLFHFRDGLYHNGRIDTNALRPIARIAGPNYAKLGEIVTMKPIVQTPKSVMGGALK